MKCCGTVRFCLLPAEEDGKFRGKIQFVSEKGEVLHESAEVALEVGQCVDFGPCWCDQQLNASMSIINKRAGFDNFAPRRDAGAAQVHAGKSSPTPAPRPGK